MFSLVPTKNEKALSESPAPKGGAFLKRRADYVVGHASRRITQPKNGVWYRWNA
jgi:hypothetical protein